MIPERRRAILPPGHWYLVHRRHGRLVVTLAAVVPVDSPLEHQLVCDAVKAWKQHQRRGLVALPGLVAAPGSWTWRGVREHARFAGGIGAGLAAGGLALAAAVVLSGPGGHPQHRPPAAVAPPATPSSPPATHRPTRPPAPKQAPRSQPARPGAGAGVAEPVDARVTLPPVRVQVPPVKVVVPPVKVIPPPVPSPPPVTATSCRLLRLDLKLVRICL